MVKYHACCCRRRLNFESNNKSWVIEYIVLYKRQIQWHWRQSMVSCWTFARLAGNEHNEDQIFMAITMNHTDTATNHFLWVKQNHLPMLCRLPRGHAIRSSSKRFLGSIYSS